MRSFVSISLFTIIRSFDDKSVSPSNTSLVVALLALVDKLALGAAELAPGAGLVRAADYRPADEPDDVHEALRDWAARHGSRDPDAGCR